MFRAFSGRNFDVFKHNQFSHQDDFPKVDSTYASNSIHTTNIFFQVQV